MSEIDRENFEFYNRHEGRRVLVRCDRSGVHFGTLVRTNGRGFVSLRDARRLWSWVGAFTLSAVAEDGVDLTESKLSRSVAEIDLHDAIEVALVSEDVARALTEVRAWTPR